MKVNTRIEGLGSVPVLLPVWVMAYRYKGKVFRFLVNGQSGKCTGTAPLSYLKIAIAVVAGLVILLAVIATLAGGCR